MKSDIFETRLLGQKAICMGGAEAAEIFMILINLRERRLHLIAPRKPYLGKMMFRDLMGT
ncbi:hypothetical protein BIV59_02385 [Bacillus sp. MUM 13]|nr:hypothetical protein BIV59_02385 [Bacillus sp. MUM 13]